MSSDRVRVTEDVELGSYGAKWRHGWIPLNAAATALKAKRLKAGDKNHHAAEHHGGFTHIVAHSGSGTVHDSLIIGPDGKGHHAQFPSRAAAIADGAEHVATLRGPHNAATARRNVGGKIVTVDTTGEAKPGDFSPGDKVDVSPTHHLHKAGMTGGTVTKTGRTKVEVQADVNGIKYSVPAHALSKRGAEPQSRDERMAARRAKNEADYPVGSYAEYTYHTIRGSERVKGVVKGHTTGGVLVHSDGHGTNVVEPSNEAHALKKIEGPPTTVKVDEVTTKERGLPLTKKESSDPLRSMDEDTLRHHASMAKSVTSAQFTSANRELKRRGLRHTVVSPSGEMFTAFHQQGGNPHLTDHPRGYIGLEDRHGLPVGTYGKVAGGYEVRPHENRDAVHTVATEKQAIAGLGAFHKQRTDAAQAKRDAEKAATDKRNADMIAEGKRTREEAQARAAAERKASDIAEGQRARARADSERKKMLDVAPPKATVTKSDSATKVKARDEVAARLSGSAVNLDEHKDVKSLKPGTPVTFNAGVFQKRPEPPHSHFNQLNMLTKQFELDGKAFTTSDSGAVNYPTAAMREDASGDRKNFAHVGGSVVYRHHAMRSGVDRVGTETVHGHIVHNESGTIHVASADGTYSGFHGTRGGRSTLHSEMVKRNAADDKTMIEDARKKHGALIGDRGRMLSGKAGPALPMTARERFEAKKHDKVKIKA